MARLRLLVPDGTVNYIKNPSFRFDATGWTDTGATSARTLERARWNVASLQVVTNGLALHEGVYYRVNALTNQNSMITGSIYVRGEGYVRVRVLDNPTGGQWSSLPIYLNDERWQRIEVTGRIKGSDDVRLYVETAGNAAQAVTFYVDGGQLELKPYATTYCDGDQEGCYWNILQHGSISTRIATTRAGGRWIEIYGEEQAEKDLYMTVIGGMGMAPIRNNIQSYADAPGSYHQNVKVLDRLIQVTFTVKHKDGQPICGPVSLAALHQMRQTLIDLVKPDKTGGDEEIVLEYLDGDYPIYAKVRYDGGLEGEWDLRNRWVMSFPVRFLGVSPYFYEDNQDVNTLDFQNTITVNYAAQRANGEWQEMNGGLNGLVRAAAIGKNGELIIGGDFTVANNSAGAINPMIPANRIAFWDGDMWNQYGTGANGAVYAIAVAPNGNVYAGGDFTSIGGVAANRIAYWDGSWHAMGSGVSSTVRDIKIAPNGDVYLVGTFTTAGGNPAYRIARYDGTYHAVGAYGGLNNTIFSLAISPDGSLIYVGGLFTDEQGNPGDLSLNLVALYEPLLDQFFEVGDGFTGSYVAYVTFSKSGRLYAGGDFTASGAQTILYVAYWNGATWNPIGTGADDAVIEVHIANDGSVLIAGVFSEVGTADSRGIGLNTGAAWVRLDINTNYIFRAALWGNYNDMFIFPNGTVAQAAGITTVNNKSSAEVHPKIFIIGPGSLLWLENQTTKKRLYIDLQLLDDEEVTIDFSKGTISSSIRGDLSYSIFPGSDTRTWSLVPGDNKIAAFMINDVNAEMYISYQQRHWSVDATKKALDL